MLGRGGVVKSVEIFVGKGRGSGSAFDLFGWGVLGVLVSEEGLGL